MIRTLKRGGIGKQEILHVAESLFHDHVPANKVGLRSAWIHRRADKPGWGATLPPEQMPKYRLPLRKPGPDGQGPPGRPPGILAGAAGARMLPVPPSARVCFVLTGGNWDVERFLSALTRA